MILKQYKRHIKVICKSAQISSLQSIIDYLNNKKLKKKMELTTILSFLLVGTLWGTTNAFMESGTA